MTNPRAPYRAAPKTRPIGDPLELEARLAELERQERTGQPAPVSQPGYGAYAPSPELVERSAAYDDSDERQGNRLALSGLIRQTLRTVATREEERRRLVNILVLAQLLLTLIIAPGYVVPTLQIPMLAALVLGLLVYAAAFVVNTAAHNTTWATYVLVFGGALAVTAHVFVSAFFANNPTETALASLLFLATILEAGLLLAPEVTLLMVAATAIITAVAVFLALSLSPAMAHASDPYLLVVYTLTLQGLTGYLAWLVSQFIFAASFESQRAQGAQYAEARLEVLQGQVIEERRRLDEGVAAIQTIITRALADDYDAAPTLPDGELRPVAESLTLLLEQMKTMSAAAHKLQRIEAMAAPLVEVAGRMADTLTPTPTTLPILTETALDSVSVAMSQAQAANARRLARVQKLASEIASALSHSRTGLSNTADEALKAQRIAGVLINMMEPLAQASRRRLDQIAQARRALGAILPPEITQQPTPDDIHRDATGLDPAEAARLLGLNVDLGIAPGYTGEFNTLSADDRADVAETGIAPLTLPLPALSAEGDASETAAKNAPTGSGRGKGRKNELPAELVDVWNTLAQMVSEGSQEERAVSNVSRDLGMLSRSVRQADAGIVWVLQALDAIRRDADQLQQISGAQPLGETGAEGDALGGLARSAPSSMPLTSPGAAPRFPSPTRPRGDLDTPGASGPLDGFTEMADGGARPTPAPQDTPGSLRTGDLLGLDVLPPDDEHHEPPTDDQAPN